MPFPVHAPGEQTRQSVRVSDLSKLPVPRSRWGDIWLLACVTASGLLFWLLYLAVQPRDYDMPVGRSGRLDALFRWRAPAIDAHDLIERDRLYLAFAGWLVVGFI